MPGLVTNFLVDLIDVILANEDVYQRLIVVLASKDGSRQTSKDLITLFSQILRKQPNLKRSSRSSRAGPTLFSSVLRRLTEQEGSRKNGGIDVAAVI